MEGIQEDRKQQTASVRHDDDDEKVDDLGSSNAHSLPQPMDVSERVSEGASSDDIHRNDDHIGREDASGLDWGGPGKDQRDPWLPEPALLSSADGGGGSGGEGGGAGAGAGGLPASGGDGGVFGFDFGGGAVAMDHVEDYEGADGGSQGGGVEWVMEGGEAIAMADEVEPLVGEIHLKLGRNFGHFFQVCVRAIDMDTY